MDATSMNASSAMNVSSAAAAMNNQMNLLQQFSQLFFLQSLAAASSTANGGDKNGKMALYLMNPAMFGLPQPQQQLFTTPPAKVPISPEICSTTQTIADLLASHQTLKSQLSPTSTTTTISSSSSLEEYSPFKSFESLLQSTTTATPTTRQYKVHVNRESAKPLQDWMNSHITDPYPSHREVQTLSNQTGFTFKQIRNWFTNSRRRFEQQCAANSLLLPWIKKDAPKVCRKAEIPSINNGNEDVALKREECS